MKPSAEALRVLERYRRLVLLGRVSLPLAEARRKAVSVPALCSRT